MTIGKLAKASDVGIETVRFYERKDMIQKPQKIGGFRYYPDHYVEQIKFIKRAQNLGFTLRETKDLLELKVKKNSECQDILNKAAEKIVEIENKISDLQKMKASLEDLANCCEDPTIALSHCSIFECFMDDCRNKDE